MEKLYGIYDGHFLLHKKECLKYYSTSQIIMLSLVGSQNYGLATEESDYDSKLMVLPSWNDIISYKEAVSTTHIMANQEHIGFTDFRKMLDILKKQNVNFLEQLFSCQYLINEDYGNEIEKLREIREDIAHYDPYKCIQTMVGIILHKCKTVFIEPENSNKKLQFWELGYNPKELMHAMRILEFLQNYIQGIPFEKCLKTQQRDYLLYVKSGEAFNIDQAKYAVNAQSEMAKDLESHYKSKHEHTKIIAIDEVFKDISESIFKKYLKNFL